MVDVVRGPVRRRGCGRPGCRRATSRCCEAIPTLAQVAVLALGGWLALHGEITHRHVPRVLDVRRAVRRAGPAARRRPDGRSAGARRRGADLPAARPAARDRRRARRGRACPSCAGEIELRDVRFGYDERAGARRARPARRAPASGSRSSARAAAASRPSTALVSPASTIPTRGQVLVDGHDVRGVTLHSLRRQVGVGVRGELPVLRHDRAPTSPTAGRTPADAEIEAAARVAGAARVHPRAARRLRHHGRRARADASPAASGSGSRWPERSCPTRGSWSSTTPPAPSTRAPRRRSTTGCAACWPAGPR